MRRLAALALGVVAASAVLTASAGAQEGYSGGWTNPSPSGERDGQPLAYLGAAQPLQGSVSHPNGIASVNVFVVPDPGKPPPDGCDPSMAPVEAQESGTTTSFQVDATFPCNIVYEIRATAQAREGGLASPTPPQYAMPLFVAVAIPPAPVEWVDATLEVDGDDRQVLLEWPANDEPDLLGYVVARDGETLGQIDAGDDTRFVDDAPPAGQTASYQVTAVRDGPDGEVEQVPSQATTVDVDVPPAEGAGDGEGDGTGDGTATTVDPGIAGDPAPAEESGRPDSGGLMSTVRARGEAPPRLGPPTTLDTGFEQTLPFDPVTGEELAAPPSGDPAVVQIFEEADTLDEKQRMSFIAGGLAVLVGAATIFYVTRRAARAAY